MPRVSAYSAGSVQHKVSSQQHLQEDLMTRIVTLAHVAKFVCESVSRRGNEAVWVQGHETIIAMEAQGGRGATVPRHWGLQAPEHSL